MKGSQLFPNMGHFRYFFVILQDLGWGQGCWAEPQTALGGHTPEVPTQSAFPTPSLSFSSPHFLGVQRAAFQPQTHVALISRHVGGRECLATEHCPSRGGGGRRTWPGGRRGVLPGNPDTLSPSRVSLQLLNSFNDLYSKECLAIAIWLLGSRHCYFTFKCLSFYLEDGQTEDSTGARHGVHQRLRPHVGALWYPPTLHHLTAHPVCILSLCHG